MTNGPGRVLGLFGTPPRYRDFHELFAKAGANVEQATGMLVELMDTWPESHGLRHELKELEHEGDRLTHELIKHLNLKAATPFPATDAHTLISELDDVVDYTEEVADFMGLYRVEAPTDQAIELTGILHSVGREIAAALANLPNLPQLRPHVVALDRLEDEGDRVERAALASLFEGGIDPMVVIRWKDIYERLEAAIDAGEHVGNALQGLIVRNI
jgi:uncharacterized protein